MPEQKIGLKSAKRFGTRYGATNKLKLAMIESEQRKLHPCPQCGKPKAKWQSVGIWQCQKCNHKFTAKAYSITKAITFKEKAHAELTPKEIEAARKAAEKARAEELAEEA